MTIECWRYQFPSEKGEGWAIIFMDSIGCFTALSDWGDVGYRWPEKGWGDKDFRLFILGCDDYYLTSKFAGGRREYDREATLKAVREHIDSLMGPGGWDIAQVEEETRRLRDCGDLYDEEDFRRWRDETEVESAHELYCTKPDHDATMFVQKVMPRLRERLKQDLKL